MGTISSRQFLRLAALSLGEASLALSGRFFRFWRLLAEEAAEGLERHRQRNALARLDRHLLKDLGLQPEQVHVEMRKWFWEA